MECGDYFSTRILSDNSERFDIAYEEMIRKLKRNYPNAEIWCCTLGASFMNNNPSFSFPYEYGGTHVEEYNKIIKLIASHFDCKIIDFYSYHINYDSIDGSHPTKEGMNTLANMVIRSMKQEAMYYRINDGLKLYNVKTRKEIIIKSDSISINTDFSQRLMLDSISSTDLIQSSNSLGIISFRKNKWCIHKLNSSIKIWINNRELKLDELYILKPNDIININQQENFIFFKSKLEKKNSKRELKGTVLDGKYTLITLIHHNLDDYYFAQGKNNENYEVRIINKNTRPIQDCISSALFMSQFNHPNIQKQIHIYEDMDYFYVILEYVNYITLKGFIRRNGVLSEKQTIDIGIQIADAVRYIHSSSPKIIHRHINPIHIALSKSLEIKLLDFSETLDFEKNRENMCFVWSWFRAKEIVYGNEDIRYDIYSIGATMYYIYTGFGFNPVCYARPKITTFNPSASKGFEYIINKCLEENPDDRYQSCEELIEDLLNYDKLPPKKTIFTKLFRNKK